MVPAVPTGTLTIAVASVGTEPVIGPFTRQATSQRTYWSLMADYLVLEKHDQSGYVPCLAEEWVISEDNTSITFRLRKDVQFHDGWGELTASDVKYTIETACSQWDQAQRYLGNLIERLEVLGPYELAIYLKTAMAEDVLHHVAPTNQVGLGIVSKAYYDSVGLAEGNRKPVFSGPYKLVEYTLGKTLEMTAVENHWRVVPEFKTVIFKEVPELFTRSAMMYAGEADVAEMTPDQAATLERDGFDIVSVPNAEYLTLALGGQWLSSVETYDPDLPWLDKRVREAMNLAIDRDEIVRELLHGLGSPISDFVHLPHADTRNPYPYDPDRAKELLTQAGYADGFDFKLWIFQFPGRLDPTDILMSVAGYWEEIGLDPEIATFNVMAVYGDIVYRKTTGVCLPMMTLRLGQPYIAALDTLVYSKSSMFPLYESAEVDAMVERYLSANNPAQRSDFVTQLADYLYQEYAFVPLVTIDKIWVTNDKIVNWAPVSLNYLELEYATHSEPLGTFRLFDRP